MLADSKSVRLVFCVAKVNENELRFKQKISQNSAAPETEAMSIILDIEWTQILQLETINLKMREIYTELVILKKS
ncbi:hypothetical protein PPTG_21627 [Phytophthora nicotianae INRA-310]|uniref:Uncharacterized protein n=1 Tax=Phytophthora nicotianae (strain INRA-310) TaxID=761204 RepID=W2QVL9_PHYN3|nr:hypothetical protein PPTG_21627 [Phytophthora nicotianae INRA-310]ETN17178.1 hypothetical protein PPTG_21627 [Phytophthora nicotianae INRA-310]